jgi:acyl-CoA reductase-like NAD-dependent aldehyde dehydrogenase
MGSCQKWQNFPGFWYPPRCTFSNCLEPSSAEVLGNVADMSRDDFIRAIRIADNGFRKYSVSTTYAERGFQLRKWFDLIHENLEDCGGSFSKTTLIGSGENFEFGKR